MYRYKSNHAKLANRELLLQVLATRGRQLTRPKVREKLLSGTRELFPCSRSVEVVRLPSKLEGSIMQIKTRSLRRLYLDNIDYRYLF
jgi:hypothetical protein